MNGSPFNSTVMFCRAYGDSQIRFGGKTYCVRERRCECEALGPQNRRFCEHCGHPDPGPSACPTCGLEPVDGCAST